MDKEEEVRPPDPIKTDCLLRSITDATQEECNLTPENFVRRSLPSHANYDYIMPSPKGFIPYSDDLTENELIKRIMEQSALEYELREAEREENRRQAREERMKHFAFVKRNFQRFSRIDNSNKDFYNEILSHISAYESGDSIIATVSREVHAKLWTTLDNMRISQEDKRRILAFICI